MFGKSLVDMSEFCACVTNKEGEWKVRLQDIWDEVQELVQVNTWDDFLDEVSDIVFGVGRLLGYFWGVNYIHVWGDERHLAKIRARMVEYGCVRSRKHLLCGKCSSTM